jgi:hypothetical protein
MGWFTDIKSLFINPDSVKCEKQKADEDEKHKKNVLEEDTRHNDVITKEDLRHKNAVIDIESNAVCVKSKDETTTTTTTTTTTPPPKSTSAMDSSSNSKNANDSVNPDEIQLEGVATATEPAQARTIGGRRTKRKNHIKKRKNTKRIR